MTKFSRRLTAGLVFFSATSAAAQSVTPRLGRVQLSTGLDMHYAEQGDPSGQPVIMLHGYSDTWYSFSFVLGKLPAGVRAYALDLRGQGKSGKPKSGYTMNDLAADVVAFMDAKGIAKATVIGHSMGGFVAQRVAQLAPQRVSHLVLIATATGGRYIAGMQDLKAAADAFTDSVPETFAREFQVSTVYGRVPDAFMARVIRDSREVPVRVWKELAQGLMSDDRPTKWLDVRIPTLIFRGDRDTYATREEQTALLGLIRGAVLKTYTNTGHALHWERSADFTRDLMAFVASN